MGKAGNNRAAVFDILKEMGIQVAPEILEQTAEEDKERREKQTERNKLYREANREKIAARDKAYREANPEKIAAKNKAYHEANREKLAEYNKAYREANREKNATYQKAYREANREKIAAQKKAYRKKLAIKKVETDIEKYETRMQTCCNIIGRLVAQESIRRARGITDEQRLYQIGYEAAQTAFNDPVCKVAEKEAGRAEKRLNEARARLAQLKEVAQ